jgi:GDP-4-dehydro-6-deoxy-D-mannose reductase
VRVLVTGASGFVGRWLLDHLRTMKDEVIAPEVDVTNPDRLRDALADVRPQAVYHLAALAHVGESWAAPRQTFEVNATGTLNLLEAARSMTPLPTVLLVGSAEVYGRVTAGELPLREDAPLRPVSPYAASKVSAEFLGMQAYLAHGLPVIRVRAFNHIGPGQAPTFVVSSLARQIAEASLHGGSSIRVGNLTPRRDFTDVRDVVRAYRLLVERGMPGEVYNVCAGEAVAISDIADALLEISGSQLEVVHDPGRVRVVDVPVLVGDPGRLQLVTGWRREHRLEASLADVLDYWRSELARTSSR